MVMKEPCHILAVFVLVIIVIGPGLSEGNSPEYVTAILGQSVVLNCAIEFPDGFAVPYIVQWSKKGDKVPIYIWYAGYPPHKGDGYKGRISLVNQASINVSDVQEIDQGWYECNVLFLNRAPDSNKNGTWVHLDVHAPPHFTVTPLEVYYVKVGDSLILTCEADGTPKPSIVWYKDEQPLEPTGNVQLYSNGHEVRITSLRQNDIGDYVCEARNGEGHITHLTKIIIAGGAVITTPPHNISKLEGEKAEFICEAKALPGNITYKWYRNDIDINELPWLSTRATKRSDGTLMLNPLTADDTGKYTCEVSNGIGTPQSASAYLDVEFPARVSYTPTLQYLPLGLSGVIRCHFESNPPFQFVTWTKDRRVFKPSVSDGIISLNNGSLFIKTVTPEHQGLYTCTPFNEHLTGGASGVMEVLVREPPKFILKPKERYQSTVNGEIKMPCEAQGNPKPEVIWRRADGAKLPRERTQIRGGNLTMKFLRKSDYGFYECVVQNEVATLVTSSLLIVESTTPHAPTNLSVTTNASSATVSWLPAYDGGYKQLYVVWYRESNRGDANWRTIHVAPEDATSFSIHNLKPDTSYDFRVLSRNILGDSMRSPIVKATTKGTDPSSHIYPTDATGSTYIPSIVQPAGDNPGSRLSAPRNVRVAIEGEGLKIAWLPPIKTAVEATTYAVEYKVDGSDSDWSVLSALIGPPALSYVFSNPLPGKTYHFRVLAQTLAAASVPSEVVQITVPGGGLKPAPPRNVTVTEIQDGIKISWLAPIETVVTPTYYVIEYKIEDGRWSQLGGHVRGTSYQLPNPMGGKTYFFRVASRTPNASSGFTSQVKFNVPARFKDKAITAGVVGGILFFIVAIILSICAVKICNKRKQRRHERAYSMVACRVTDVRNGGHGPAGSPVPLRKFTESRVSGVNLSALRRKVTRFTRLAFGLRDDQWQHMDESRVSWGLDSRLQSSLPPPLSPQPLLLSSSSSDAAPPPPFSSQTERTRRFPRSVRYQVEVEYSQPAGYISRRADGRFELGDTDDGGFVSRHHRRPIPSIQGGSYRYSSSPRSLVDSFFQSEDERPTSVSWERVPQIHTIYSPRDPRFRTSSPGPIARVNDLQIEDLSSVLLPSSAERSFPSTVSSRFTNSAIFSPSCELPSLRVIHEHLPYIREECEPPTRSVHQLPEGYYDYPPRPRPYVAAPSYARYPDETPKLPVLVPRERRMETTLGPQSMPSPTAASSKVMSPPPVPDIEWRQIPQHQLDVYKRIQDMDEQRPLATSSPPRSGGGDRRIARVPPSPSKAVLTETPSMVVPRRESGGSVSGSDDRPIAYTRDRLQEVIGQVRRGVYRGDHRPFRGAVSDPITVSFSQGPAQLESTEGIVHLTERDEDDADVSVTSEEAFRSLGVVGEAASTRVSVTSAGTLSSGRGSKAASLSHSRGDSIQGDLEYSPTSRSSSSGFASRNTSQSQPSPHQAILVGLPAAPSPLPPPLPPLSSHPMVGQYSFPLPPLNVSTDENYEFDVAHPAEAAARDSDRSRRQRAHHSEQALPEHEALGATDQDSSSRPTKITKYDDVEIERRIPALKEEFHQFRRRQLERRRSDEIESEC